MLHTSKKKIFKGGTQPPKKKLVEKESGCLRGIGNDHRSDRNPFCFTTGILHSDIPGDAITNLC